MTDAARPPSVTDLDAVGRPLLAVALGAGPVAWTIHLVASVALVPYACETGAEWPLHLVTVGTAAAAGIGLAAALRLRRSATGPGADAAVERAGFLARIALFLGVLFLVLIVVEAIPVLLLDPCG